MRLKEGAFILVLLLVNVAAQAQKLRYIKKNVSLVKLFKEIKSQTGVSVVWNEKEFNVDQQIDANFRNIELKRVMDEVSGKIPLTYTMMGKMIIVKERKIVDIPEQQVLAEAKIKSSLEDRMGAVQLQQVNIVSTGYQQLPKERAPGSFVLVDSAQLNRKVGPDIFSRLEGITSGLMFNKNTVASLGGGLDLSIRARSTIYANDQPLVILDNFPLYGDFNSINPHDVASITVLKDAAAASIWGVRAGNGVIVITTKKAKFNQSLNVSFNSNLTVAAKPDVFYSPNYLSSSDFIDIETFLFNKGRYDVALGDKINYPAVSPVVKLLDRQRKGQLSAAVAAEQINALRRNDIRNEELKYYYRNPVSQQYFLNLSKGTSRSNHYLSAGYDRQQFSLVNNEDTRITVNTQHSVKLLKNLELTAGLYYVRKNGKSDSTILTKGKIFQPYYQFRDASGRASVFEMDFNTDFTTEALSKGFLDWSYRPLDELGKSPDILKSNDLRLDGGLKYTVVPGLSVMVKALYNRATYGFDEFHGIETYSTRNSINRFSIVNGGQVTGYNVPLGGILFQRKMKYESKNFRTQLNYEKDWDKHAVSALAGYELSEYDSQANQYLSYGLNSASGQPAVVDTLSVFNQYPSGTGKISAGRNLFGKLDRIRSAFANASYTYDRKYTWSISARMDASNYFGVKTNQKNVPLWSAGTLWQLDRESFYKVSWLPVLKLRASYGYNGNLDKTNTGIATIRNSSMTATYTNLPFVNLVSVGNPQLRWEKIAIANFGIDFGFKDQVVSGRFEYYFKSGTDMLGDKTFPASSGIMFLRGNYSKMKGSGIDLMLTAQNLKGKVKWQTNFLLSAMQDRITLYDVVGSENTDYVGESSIRPVVGKPVNGIYSYKWAGLDPLTGDPRGYLHGEISKEYSRIMAETKLDELEYHGAARPTVFGGLNNTISYRRFTLGFNIGYKLGYYFKKPTVNYFSMYEGLTGATNVDFTQRWQKSGDEKITNIPSMGKYEDGPARDRFYNGSSVRVAKGDHIRLQDISFSFDLDRSNWKNIPMKHVQLYAYVNNLGLIWKANDFGLDPDVVPYTGDRLSYPLPISFSVGIKTGF
ncbi:SusC/RagA family TonB-linked outer membrane protein [Pedobacter nyackensis]|uniref:TonB-linked outer membrane protein, SusC/RagA family n=1 Tax=Pedobacter nyackensis TaxID=475255 RepID=A0A1W2CZI7_9SPHI|nr:SusC/RagA family TonB-linked outer membrane protein [Pedobacter nyackensis]SMC90232.1 TonB-linked outer membrane protein, SusC/RagA family [Pedobacter nyackensis]